METGSSFERIRPLGNKVFVEVDKPREKTLASGLILPSAAQEAMFREGQQKSDQGIVGRVVAVGRGRTVGNRFIESTCKVDQRVVISEHTSHVVQHRPTEERGKTLYQLWDDEILAIVED